MEKYCKSCGRVFKDSDFRICPYCGNQLSTRTGRQPIPRKLRHQVFQRDGYRCRECGATNKQTRLHVDHIVPVAKGGTNDLSNLQTLCEECNRAKYTDEWVGGVINSVSKQKNKINLINEDNIAFTPAEIREKYNNINEKFISGGKIPSVEEIMDRAGVKYKIIEKNKWYKILDKEMSCNQDYSIDYGIFTPAEIRKKYDYINQMFISHGKIAGVEEIMDRAGVKYKILQKNKLYRILG